MNLFVTGGTGFIGGHFLNAASHSGHQLTAVRRPGSSPRIPLNCEPRWIEGGLREAAQAFSAKQQRPYDAVVHLAAAGVNPAAANWEDCFQTNVIDSVHLWLSAVRAGVTRLVVCGSCFEYGKAGDKYEAIPATAALEPVGPYAASKAAASIAALALAQTCNAEVAILRPFHVFGEGESDERLWPSLRRAAASGCDMPMTLGQQVRDFVEVSVVVTELLKVATVAPLRIGLPDVRNVGSGSAQTVRSFAAAWWDRWEAKGKLLFGAIPYRDHEIMRLVPDLRGRSPN